MNLEEAAKAFGEFVSVVRALRTPGTGCPWDLKQDHHTLRPYLIEETHEVLEAIDGNDDRAFREELGDLLLQIVLHAQVAQDRNAFSIMEVIRGITEKMVRRHPHVFGSVQVSGSADVIRNWEQIKAAERMEKGEDPNPVARLAKLPKGLPALLAAQRLGGKAAKLGRDGSSMGELLAQVREQLARLEALVTAGEGSAQASGTPTGPSSPTPDRKHARLEQEMGDLLFNLCQLARRAGVNAEDSLRACNTRFVTGFEGVSATPQREPF